VSPPAQPRTETAPVSETLCSPVHLRALDDGQRVLNVTCINSTNEDLLVTSGLRASNFMKRRFAEKYANWRTLNTK
jgi:hypothetical protein